MEKLNEWVTYPIFLSEFVVVWEEGSRYVRIEDDVGDSDGGAVV